MCLAIPVEIVEIENQVATCRVGEGETTIQASLMLMSEDAGIGDWIIVHAGFALRKLDEAEAKETLRLMREIIEAADEAGVVQDAPVDPY